MIVKTSNTNQLARQRCPHCRTAINLKDLPHQGLFASDRVCPDCGGSFTVDTGTKYRQALFFLLLLVSAAFTFFLYFGDSLWLIPAIMSYIGLAIIMYSGSRNMFFVPYNEGVEKKHDA